MSDMFLPFKTLCVVFSFFFLFNHPSMYSSIHPSTLPYFIFIFFLFSLYIPLRLAEVVKGRISFAPGSLVSLLQSSRALWSEKGKQSHNTNRNLCDFLTNFWLRYKKIIQWTLDYGIPTGSTNDIP